MTQRPVETTVARITKNRSETVHIRVVQFHETWCTDLRVFVAGDDGEPLATKKGVAVNLRLLRPLIEALQAAERTAIEQGLLHAERA